MNLLAKVEAMRARSATREAETKAVVRSALESSGMAETCDSLRDIFGARMTYLKVGDLEIGTPDTEQGITLDKIVLVDWERKQREKAAAKKGGRN